MASADSKPGFSRLFEIEDYDLARTLNSGQSFRWQPNTDGWTGVVGKHWVLLKQLSHGFEARIATPTTDWDWLETYLQTNVDFRQVLANFPDHPFVQEAISQHRGLRLLQQDPWECLASFILSSTKQIVHVRQIVALLCERYGCKVSTPEGFSAAYLFPDATIIAELTESELRDLRMGFRAPYLREAAGRVASRQLDFEHLRNLSLAEAREALMELPGVGRKIADCVLLFSLGFNQAFPVDVWVMRSLNSGWFPSNHRPLAQLVEFAESAFGSYGGYVQQYLFHHTRTLQLAHIPAKVK